MVLFPFVKVIIFVMFPTLVIVPPSFPRLETQVSSLPPSLPFPSYIHLIKIFHPSYLINISGILTFLYPITIALLLSLIFPVEIWKSHLESSWIFIPVFYFNPFCLSVSDRVIL